MIHILYSYPGNRIFSLPSPFLDNYTLYIVAIVDFEIVYQDFVLYFEILKILIVRDARIEFVQIV